MTRDELRDKVEKELRKQGVYRIGSDEWMERKSELLIRLFFAALKEPTEEMSDAGVKSDVLLSAIIDWQGSYTPKEDVASDIWELMLSASPLAPSKEEK